MGNEIHDCACLWICDHQRSILQAVGEGQQEMQQQQDTQQPQQPGPIKQMSQQKLHQQVEQEAENVQLLGSYWM